MGKASYFSVFGTDYDTPDGSAIRDYVHVSDLADAHVRAAQYLVAQRPSVAINLGTGVGSSVLEMLNAVARATGRIVPTQYSPRRLGDPPILYADATRARHDLGWTPKFTNLQATVDTAARWFTSKT